MPEKIEKWLDKFGDEHDTEEEALLAEVNDELRKACQKYKLPLNVDSLEVLLDDTALRELIKRYRVLAPRKAKRNRQATT